MTEDLNLYLFSHSLDHEDQDVCDGMLVPSAEFPLFLLSVLLHFNPSLAYSLKSCTVSYSKNTTDVWVECSHRGLTAVPSDVPKNTTSLDLSFNTISKINSSDLSGLSKLRYLQIGESWISHVNDGAFGHLAELLELDMDRKNFTKVTDNMFLGLWKLTVLSLDENH